MKRWTAVRLLQVASAVAVTAFLLAQIAFAFDVYSFEWRSLFMLLGWQGLASIMFVNAAAILLFLVLLKQIRGSTSKTPRTIVVILALAGVLVAWASQYVLLENPPTAALAHRFHTATAVRVPDSAKIDFDNFSLRTLALNASASDRLGTMYSRIWVNAPDTYDRHPIGQTIDRYAAKYKIDPIFLFFRAYLISFFGQATSGPVPFLGMMTTETINDVVQIHLPAWFVESDLRQHLISSPFLNRVMPEAMGTRVRYAIHKATLDVSTAPYDVSTFSDIFLVLKEFPSEFPDVLGPSATDPLKTALRDSFERIRTTALVKPYGNPYDVGPYDDIYYDSFRDDMKRFARAAYYLTVTDFDFATRIQALLATYHRDLYQAALGEVRWHQLPRWQQLAMLAMVRDLYSPNIGHLGYNMYALPELNCTPLEFVATSARNDTMLHGTEQETIWRPENYEYLLSAGGYQLTVLNEVWSLMNPTPIPGIRVNSTAESARRIVGHELR